MAEDTIQPKPIIMAGGKGTRISSVASDIPKPMIKVCDKPILELQIDCLRKQGLNEITIIIGHLGHVIKQYFGDGSAFGVNIKYIEEKEPLGTAGGIYHVDHGNQPLLIINGDIVFDIDFTRFFGYHRMKQADITLFTHPNNHPYDSALIETIEDGRIVNWFNKEDKRETYKNRVNAGLHIIEPHVFDFMKSWELPQKWDLDRQVLKPDIKKYRMYAYDSPEYVKDMGTPERYEEVCNDIDSGLPTSKNLLNKQRAIFLDRDGVINEHVGFITKPEQISLLEAVPDAVRMINRSGCLAMIITNQPVIARGDCTVKELNVIHNKIETLLGQQGAYVDDIIYCPHHPDKGFHGERPELKIDCDCRKPKPGMLYLARDKYNIDLTKSYMIGDEWRDIKAGIAARCKTGYVGKDQALVEKADFADTNLISVMRKILTDETR